MNNSVYGKTQENLRNQVQVELVTESYTFVKELQSQGNPSTDCLTVVQCRVVTLTLNQPIYIGFVVLELSKLHMYDL